MEEQRQSKKHVISITTKTCMRLGTTFFLVYLAVTWWKPLLNVLGKMINASAPLLIGFHQSLRMWKLKGHTTTEIVTGKLDPEGGDIISFEAARRKKAKVGRNDPCPCGSGKKYKNCCMRKDL